MKPGKTDFAGLRMPEAAVTANLTGTLDRRRRRQDAKTAWP